MYPARMILLRHAQSEFNLHFTATRRDPGIIDPKLTPLGHRQAREAAARLMLQEVRRRSADQNNSGVLANRRGLYG
jgi:broad specificity phosphatase PhoE